MERVTPNVYVESGINTCNLGVITTKEGIVVIDTPSNLTTAVKWRDELAKIGSVRYVINTEEHFDHCQTSWFFPGVLITSQETRDKIAKVSVAEMKERIRRREPAAAPLLDTYQLRLADIAFTGDLTFHLGAHTFHLIPLPGHTTGGIGVFIPEERVVFTTDCIFYKVKTWLQEADPAVWLESLCKLAALDVDFMVPGHGGVCRKDYVSEQTKIVKQWVEVMKSAITGGLSEEQTLATLAKSPPDPYPKQARVHLDDAQLNKMSVAHLYKFYSR